MTTATSPRISVIVPGFDGSAVIDDCLRSIRASSFGDYELIVVDDGSSDDTAQIAKRYADIVVELPENRGRHVARCAAIEKARGEIVVHIDQDVVIRPDALEVIDRYFAEHPDVAAITGILSLEHPNPDFYSQYKNIYMHEVFRNLPDFVEFLYGSLFALRREAFYAYGLQEVGFEAHDTAWGQRISTSGGRIVLLKDLEVIHLKRYSFVSLLKNDFAIPYHWGVIFVAFKRWRGLLRRTVGFAHASKRQMAGLVLAYASVAALLCALAWPPSIAIALVLVAVWGVTHGRFLSFVASEKGWAFAWRAAALTFLDNVVMGLGALSGVAHELAGRARA
jgi:glycosyltransferase involved in cell wall biosynthesis